jgi:hypothetical protein
MPEKAGDGAPSRRQTRVLRARPSLSTVSSMRCRMDAATAARDHRVGEAIRLRVTRSRQHLCQAPRRIGEKTRNQGVEVAAANPVGQCDLRTRHRYDSARVSGLVDPAIRIASAIPSEILDPPLQWRPHMALGPGVPDPPPAWCDYQKASSRHRHGESYAVRANPSATSAARIRFVLPGHLLAGDGNVAAGFQGGVARVSDVAGPNNLSASFQNALAANNNNSGHGDIVCNPDYTTVPGGSPDPPTRS